MMKVKDSTYKFFRFWIFITFITAMYPWPLWITKGPIVSFVGAVISIQLIQKHPRMFTEKTLYHPVVIAFIFLFLWMGKLFSIVGIAEQIFYCVVIYAVGLLKSEYQLDLMRYITKYFALLLGVSLFFYILMIVNVPLPHSELTYRTYNFAYDNYYFFVTFPWASLRFQSIFLEPGHLTIGIAPLLFINKYDVRNKYVVILMLAQLFTVSLAGYILLFVGLILTYILTKSKDTIKLMVGAVIVLGVFIYGAQKLYDDSEIFERMVLDRLEMTSEGTIKGDDRTMWDFDAKYDKFMKTPYKWIGNPDPEQGKGEGAGYKVYIYDFGIIGLVLVILCYTLPMLKYKKRSVTFFSILLLLMLYPNSYPHWMCVVFSLILGTNYLAKNNDEKQIITKKHSIVLSQIQ